MKNVRLDELQVKIKIGRRKKKKIGGRNINNLRYVAESKQELKNLLMRLKEESEKTGLKLNIKPRSCPLALLLHGKWKRKR